jgi:hypothetical protein
MQEGRAPLLFIIIMPAAMAQASIETVGPPPPPKPAGGVHV